MARSVFESEAVMVETEPCLRKGKLREGAAEKVCNYSLINFTIILSLLFTITSSV